MSDHAPGQLGGRRLERMRKPDLLAYARSSPACRCGRAQVMGVILDRADRREKKRVEREANVTELKEAA